MSTYLTIDEFLESLEEGGPKGQIPPDSGYYEEAARKFFAAFDESWCDSELDDRTGVAYADWLEKQQKLVDALRWLLSHDGRSFRALLWIAEWKRSSILRKPLAE